jgi:hypothetical protein
MAGWAVTYVAHASKQNNPLVDWLGGNDLTFLKSLPNLKIIKGDSTQSKVN